MKLTVGCIALGCIVLTWLVQNSASPGRQLSSAEMREIRGGQLGGHEHGNKKCAHVDNTWGENPCVADENCPVDVEACAGVQEYASTNVFWKCIPWLATRTCTVSTETATCVFSVPCVVVNNQCVGNPDPLVPGTSVVEAPTSCAD